MKHILLIILFLFPAYQIFSQSDTNNYKIKEVGSIITFTNDTKKNMPNYPNFACEVNIGTNYTFLFSPKQLSNVIDGKGGMYNYDIGFGLKFRLKNKFYLGINYSYFQYSLDQNYQAIVEYNNDTSAIYNISEEGKVYNKGINIFVEYEGNKLFYNLGMSFSLFSKYQGFRTINNKNKYKISEDNYIVTDKYSKDIKLIFKFGYNKKLRPELIIKPFLSMSYSFSPVYHTRYFITKENGSEKELNMHFAAITIGISVDYGIKNRYKN